MPHAVCVLLLMALLGGSAASLAAATPQRPNILVVLVDDMRWDEFGAAGHPVVATPSIDRLAREGVRFTESFVTTPLCSPSRASLLTGRYAHAHGILDNTLRPSHHLPIFPLALQRAGYRTGFFGKWHMGNDDLPRAGFDRWVGMAGQGEALDPSLNIDGRRSRARGHVSDVLTDEALRFIAERDGRPFMVWLAHKALHPNGLQRDDGSWVDPPPGLAGFVPAARHRGRHAGQAMPRRPNAYLPPVDKPALARAIAGLPPLGPDTATRDHEIRGRLEMLLGVDESLGRLLERLAEAGELDRTVVVFTSDNGYFHGEHGLNEERRLAYEESIRVPLLVRYPPRARAGRTPAAMVLGIDLAPTVLELAGLPADPGFQGRSLVPLLEGREPADWRQAFLVEYTSDTVFPRIDRMGYRAVRTARHKLIRYRDLPGVDELYDLASDPYELRNRIAEPSSAAVLATLDAELAALAGPRVPLAAAANPAPSR